MSGNLFKNFVSHYPWSSQKPVMQSWFFCSLIGEFEVNSKGYKSCINLIFIHVNRKAVYKHVILWWREHISQSKFKDDIESLNTDDVLSVILKAMKLNFNLKFDAFSNTFYLWIGILKTCISYTKMTFYANQNQKEKQAGHLKWFNGFGKRKYLNNFWRNISLDSSYDAI